MARYHVKMVTVNSAVWRFCQNHRSITWTVVDAWHKWQRVFLVDLWGVCFQSGICFVSSRSWKDVNIFQNLNDTFPWNKLRLWYLCTMLHPITFSQQYTSFYSCENDLISSDTYFWIIERALISLGRLFVCRVTCSVFGVLYSLMFLS